MAGAHTSGWHAHAQVHAVSAQRWMSEWRQHAVAACGGWERYRGRGTTFNLFYDSTRGFSTGNIASTRRHLDGSRSASVRLYLCAAVSHQDNKTAAQNSSTRRRVLLLRPPHSAPRRGRGVTRDACLLPRLHCGWRLRRAALLRLLVLLGSLTRRGLLCPVPHRRIKQHYGVVPAARGWRGAAACLCVNPWRHASPTQTHACRRQNGAVVGSAARCAPPLAPPRTGRDKNDADTPRTQPLIRHPYFTVVFLASPLAVFSHSRPRRAPAALL
jgi:hypothetical protein